VFFDSGRTRGGTEPTTTIVPRPGKQRRNGLRHRLYEGLFHGETGDEGLSVTGIDADEGWIETARRTWVVNERTDSSVTSIAKPVRDSRWSMSFSW
jgi:hypothetical protein